MMGLIWWQASGDDLSLNQNFETIWNVWNIWTIAITSLVLSRSIWWIFSTLSDILARWLFCCNHYLISWTLLFAAYTQSIESNFFDEETVNFHNKMWKLYGLNLICVLGIGTEWRTDQKNHIVTAVQNLDTGDETKTDKILIVKLSSTMCSSK